MKREGYIKCMYASYDIYFHFFFFVASVQYRHTALCCLITYTKIWVVIVAPRNDGERSFFACSIDKLLSKLPVSVIYLNDETRPKRIRWPVTNRRPRLHHAPGFCPFHVFFFYPLSQIYKK